MRRHSYLLFAVVFFLFSIGLVMVFNTSSAAILDRQIDKSTYDPLIRQLLYAALGLLLALAAWRLGYERMLKYSGSALLFFTFLLVLVFIPAIGQEINGARRWIHLGALSFQPSEFVKYLIPLYYIKVFLEKKSKLSFRHFLRLMAQLAVPLALILFEPDNGTVAIIFVSMVALFIMTRLNLTYWAVPVVCFVLLGGAIASQMKHVPDRIRVYLHPELDLRGKGHQPYQAKIAAGSGGLFGKGPGESMQKLHYLPEARNDYIAAIFAEEYGFVGICLLIFLYMLIGYLGFYLAAKANDLKGVYVGFLLTFLICFQAFLNLGVVSGLLPSKGTNLPFFSQGGSSLVANFISIGFLLQMGKKRGERRGELCKAK